MDATNSGVLGTSFYISPEIENVRPCLSLAHTASLNTRPWLTPDLRNGVVVIKKR